MSEALKRAIQKSSEQDEQKIIFVFSLVKQFSLNCIQEIYKEEDGKLCSDAAKTDETTGGDGGRGGS